MIVRALILMTLLGVGLGADPLKESDLSDVKVVHHTQHILYETYLETDDGLASVFGYHFDASLDARHWFVLSIYGAVAGDRGGYGIAALGYAYTYPLTDRLTCDFRVSTGSGGGGGLPAGGGFMLEALAGLQWKVSPRLSIEGHVGYLDFPSGTFHTPVVNIGLSYPFKGLYLPYR
jgi:hypothetical protein